MKPIYIVASVLEFDEWALARAEKGIVTRGIAMTPDTFAKIFTPERIKLIQRIRQNKINNIYQIAKEMDKPYEVVFRNLKYLEGQGFIKFDKKSKNKIPHLAIDFRIEMFHNFAKA
jgi:predicted transcriptional regulator